MEKHHRRSIRLREYDYSHAGVYFVTICVKNRECLFGEIIDGVIHSNEACDMIVAEWSDLLNRFSNIDLDEFVVMPNHLHGLLVLFGRGESCIRPDKNITIEEGDHEDRPYINKAVTDHSVTDNRHQSLGYDALVKGRKEKQQS